MMVNTVDFNLVGGFDTAIFLYYEDRFVQKTRKINKVVFDSRGKIHTLRCQYNTFYSLKLN
jgi:hypothetical protein